MTGKHVIGIDAGGTKTLGLLVDESEEILCRAQAAGSNIRSVGVEAAERNLKYVLAELMHGNDVQALCVGAAGVARARDREQFLSLINKHTAGRIIVELRNDAQIVLRAATNVRPAVALIAGTGSLAYGESQGGTARAGGYGAVIGDPGSGYAIGIDALRATAQAMDEGVATSGTLARSVMQALGATSVDEVIERVHRWPPDVALIASLCKLVSRAADNGDASAQRILEDATAALARLLRGVIKKIRSAAPLPVVLSGGVFDVVPQLHEALARRVSDCGPCSFVRLAAEPALGAALIALDALKQQKSQDTLKQQKSQTGGADL